MNFKHSKRDQFRGHRGKLKRKQMYRSKISGREALDSEIRLLEEKSGQFDPASCKSFADFPLSKKTHKGLQSCKYEVPTDIQRESIGLSLQGHDVLGAAKTGSGKTLAFVVPVLECLFKLKWSQLDGLGAMIISPTRELAYQTFEVLRKVGRFHDFSAGLIIGGKPLNEEAGRINRTNIIVCTPGRLLQHFDETTYFTADSLKVLVLDEADRILDLGFSQTMNAIISSLPTERQTLLFSATQTRSVKDLARLSLREPMFVSVHENATESTPSQLEQNYMVCELHDKMNILWSFLRNHLKAKILVFLTSCKQVKYVHEAFRRMRPGIPVLALHGGMAQLKRVAVYKQFVWKQNVCMFATDIAARGLDFLAVNWVVQLDCPEDANTYIHRVGRTARYEKDGESLLVLLPSEEQGMVKQLQEKKIPIEEIKVNKKKLLSIQAKLEANCAADPALKESAQKAFMSYLKSIYLMGNKKVFDVHAVDIEEYSRSLGLAIAPKVRFLKRDQKRVEEKESQKVNVKNKKDNEREQQVKVKSSGSDASLLDRLSGNLAGALSGSEAESDNISDSDDNVDSDEASGSDSDEEESEDDPATNSDSNCETNQHLQNKKTALKGNKKSVTSVIKKQNAATKQGNHVDTDSSSESSDSESGESDTEEESSESDSASEVNSELQPGNLKPTAMNFEISDDEKDELLTVKRKVNVEEEMGLEEVESSEETEKPTKKTKKSSKFATAKKLLKMNMVVNSKVKFDDEGEMEVDKLKQPQVDLDTERSDNAGGINIDLARQRMKAEDQIDKELYRQRIRERHREERLKRREENRAKKQQQQMEGGEAVLASGGDSDDDDDRPEPVIPDLYGSDGSSDSSSESDTDRPSPSKRRKFTPIASDSGSSDDGEFSDSEAESDEDDFTKTEMSLQDEEALALKLLNG